MKSIFASLAIRMKENMTLFLVLLFIWQVQFSGNCQKVWVTPDVKIKNDFSFEILGKWPSKNVLIFRDKLFSYEIEAYDEEMKFLWTKPLKLSDSKAQIIGISHIDSSFTIFYSVKRNDITVIHCKTYNENLELLHSKQLYRSKKRFVSHSFRFTLSENNKRALIFYIKAKTQLHLMAFDLDNLLAKDPIVINFQDRRWRSQLEGIEISNNGDCFIIRDVSSLRSNKDKISILCNRVSKDGQITSSLVQPGDFYSGDVHYVYDNIYNKLILAGTYKDKNNDWANGFWIIKVEDNLEWDELVSFEFIDNELQEINGNSKHTLKGIKDLFIADIIQRKDGGSLIIGEIQKEYSRRPDLNPRLNEMTIGVKRWVDYYYEDMLLMSVHPNGDFHWSSVLHKRQYSQDDEAVYSSFFIMKNPAMLKFIFNDEIKNSNTISEYVVTSRGLLERNSLMNTANLKLQMRLMDATQVGPRTILIPSLSNHQLNIVKMVF